MIKLTNIDGQKIYLQPNAITRITESSVSGKWHGIQSYVKTSDGVTIEAYESCDEILKQMENEQNVE
jgi:hypothetical protein